MLRNSIMKYSFIIYAPNINNGGGLILLKSLIDNIPEDLRVVLILDSRSRDHFNLINHDKYWIEPKLFSRLFSEILLLYLSALSMTCFCFNGLPPLLPLRCKKIVFLQNRNIIESKMYGFSVVRTKLRVRIERWIFKLFYLNVDTYIVQTISMKDQLMVWIEKRFISRVPNISVIPFNDLDNISKLHGTREIKYDFIYPADGEGHKNHKNLLASWIILAREGIFPILAITLDVNRYPLLISCYRELGINYGLKIINLGFVSHEKMLSLYSNSSALIYPSFLESFGLPLVEAGHLGLPILAAELDYVRDVASPVQTFDPNSSRSIASAVKRYLGVEDRPIEIANSQNFWNQLTKDI